MTMGFFENPATAYIARPLQYFGNCIAAPFKAIFDTDTFAHSGLIVLGLLGGGFGGLGGIGYVGTMAYNAWGAASAMGVAGIIGGGIVGAAGGFLAGGAALGAGYLAVAGVMGTGVGLLGAVAGLGVGTIETIGHHLGNRNTAKTTAPVPAMPVPQADPVMSTYNDIAAMSTPERTRLLKKLSESFDVPARPAETTIISGTAPVLNIPRHTESTPEKAAMVL